MLDIEKNFFGRQDVLSLLKKRVIDLKDGYRQNLAFLGPQFIGKTSILQKFICDLDDKDLVTVYVNFERKDLHYLFTNFVGSILYHFSKNQGLEPHQDINLLIEATKSRLPQTVSAIKHVQALLEKRRMAEAYQGLISLLETFSIESNKFCLVVFDEFHHLEDFDIPDAFQELGKRIMTQKRCLYVMASSFQHLARKILSEKLSLLFGHFEVLEIEPLMLKTSQEFITHSLKDIQIKDPLKNFLVDFTGGHPFYLNILIGELVQLCQIHRQTEIFLPLLSQAIENTIFNRWGVLSRHFEILTDHLTSSKDSHETFRLLIALADPKNKIEDVVVSNGLKKMVVKQKIAKLLEADLLDRNGHSYYLKDKLFRYWIKYILRQRLSFIGLDLKEERELFRKELASAMSDFYVVSQKDLSLRVIELLSCFQDEIFSLHGRRYRLSPFQKFKSSKLRVSPERQLDTIKAYTSEGSWVIVLNEKDLSENEMSVFVNEVKKTGQKSQKQIIISLANLENPVRLRALQEKMWIWSERELNFLFNMYDKPYIVK
ncbi:MAG: ATP-binding protein [Candidatus Omnitrophota bacterium]